MQRDLRIYILLIHVLKFLLVIGRLAQRHVEDDAVRQVASERRIEVIEQLRRIRNLAQLLVVLVKPSCCDLVLLGLVGKHELFLAANREDLVVNPTVVTYEHGQVELLLFIVGLHNRCQSKFKPTFCFRRQFDVELCRERVGRLDQVGCELPQRGQSQRCCRPPRGQSKLVVQVQNTLAIAHHALFQGHVRAACDRKTVT